MTSTASRLKGVELIEKVRSMGDAPKSEKARACGYVSTGVDGRTRINYSGFFEELAIASGIPLDEPKGIRTRELSYQSTVLTTGAIQIGTRYAQMIGAHPGGQVEFEIQGEAILVRMKID